MTITKRVRQQMLDGDAEDAALIRLDPHPAHVGKAIVPAVVRAPKTSNSENSDTTNTSSSSSSNNNKVGQAWSAAEHERFLEALAMYPSGPWKLVAAHVGTRTTRQTMTHAQKYRQKIERQRRRTSQQQQQQSQPLAPKEEADNEAAIRARAAIVALQQAADVFHAAGNDNRLGAVDQDASDGSSSLHKRLSDLERCSELTKASARSLLLSESSKVTQAVVSLIQLAEPTTVVGRLPSSSVEPIGNEASSGVLPSA